MAGKAQGVGRSVSQETCPRRSQQHPFAGKGVYVMWRRFSLLSTAMPLLGLTAMADVVCAADPPDLVQQLLERIRVLEERLDRLGRGGVVKKAGGEIRP